MNKNDFAPRPPMGWNSYDYYDTAVDEAAVKANADFMAEHLREYGWEYVVVDIEWYAHGAGTERSKYQYIPFSRLEMDEYSRLLPDPDRFPSSKNGAGFGPLADYVHGLGLKFGIHIMRGIPRIAAHRHCTIQYDNAVTQVKDSIHSDTSLCKQEPVLNCSFSAADVADPSSICGWNPDMYGVRNIPEGQAYYDSLIALYASWGVDFIKCDDICNTNIYPHNPYSARHEIEMLARAIANSGRAIVLSLSPGPALIEQAWHYETHANMWRITDDFWDDWRLLKDMFKRCELWQAHVKSGCYPDCDMLPLGYLGKGFGQERTTNFTHDEQRTMMTLWCLFGSPLMLGAELTKLDDWTMSLLTNRDVLNMQSPAYRPHQLYRDDRLAVWTACRETDTEIEIEMEIENKTDTPVYIALFNLSEEEQSISLPLNDLLTGDCSLGENMQAKQADTSAPLTLCNLWENASAPLTEDAIRVTLKPHACAAYKL